MTDILIDHRIRDWVFLPLILVMFMVSVCKHYFQLYSQYTAHSAPVTQKTQVSELVDKYLDPLSWLRNITKKAQQLAQFSPILPEQSFKMRRAYLCDHTNGLLTKCSQKPAKDPLQSMSAMNPTAMADMLKGNLSGIMTMGVQYQWVSYFFSGFILGKVPFPLTQKFRGMLQRGVEIQNLNVRYVSSLSLYFLVLFGAHKLLTLIIGQDEDDDLQV